LARKSAHIIRAEINQIRRLLEDKDRYWTDTDIITKLNLNWRTYYRYKARIAEEDKELWQKIRSESLEKRALGILQALDDGYRTAKKIRDNHKALPKDRMEAAKVAIKAKVNIYYLMEDGPLPNLRAIREKATTQYQNL
jgi:hypothetical protein